MHPGSRAARFLYEVVGGADEANKPLRSPVVRRIRPDMARQLTFP